MFDESEFLGKMSPQLKTGAFFTRSYVFHAFFDAFFTCFLMQLMLRLNEFDRNGPVYLPRHHREGTNPSGLGGADGARFLFFYIQMKILQ